MTQRIHRLQVSVGAPETFNVTGYVGFLSVAPARNGVYGIDVWYLVDDTVETVAPLTVSVAGTGHPLSETEGLMYYVGTCVMSDALVWHVFVRRGA
jgi:hypothetical protein